MIEVQVPGFGTIEFADGTSPAEIERVIRGMQSPFERRTGSVESVDSTGATNDRPSAVGALLGPSPVERLENRAAKQAQIAGIAAHGDIRRGTQDDPPMDPGVLMPALRRGADAAAGWTVGLAERAGLVEPGTRQEMLATLEAEREASLLHGDADARALALGTGELAGGVVGGVVPGLSLGRAVGAVRGAAGLSNAARLAAGAGLGALEGGLQVLGDTAGTPEGVMSPVEFPGGVRVPALALGAGLGALSGGAGVTGGVDRATTGPTIHAPNVGDPSGLSPATLRLRAAAAAGDPDAADLLDLSTRSAATLDDALAATAEIPRLQLRTPRWADSITEGTEKFRNFIDRQPAGRVLSPDDLPFELIDLPLSRWETDPRSNPARGGAKFYFLGDETWYKKDSPVEFTGKEGGGPSPVVETFTPQNPMVVMNPGWASGRDLALTARAAEGGHDAVIMLGSWGDSVEVIKMPWAADGIPRSSSFFSALDKYPGTQPGELAMREAVYGEPIAAGIERAAPGDPVAQVAIQYGIDQQRSGWRALTVQRLSRDVVDRYQVDRAKLDVEIDNALAASAAAGRIPTPEQATEFRAMRQRHFERDWHDRLAQTSRAVDSPAIHALADETERAAPIAAPTPTPKTLPSGEAGFIKIPGRSQPTSTPRPTDAVIRYGNLPREPIRQRLRRAADRWIDEMSDKEDAPVRALRRAGLKDESGLLARYIGRARGASRIAQLPLFKGVYEFDAATGTTRRTHDSLHAVIGGLDEAAERDLNDLFAAERHMELLGRRDRARADYDAAREARLGELADVRNADKADLKAGARTPLQVRDAAMGLRGKLPPVEPHPDIRLDISDEGTRIAQQTLADLESRYGADVDPVTGARTIRELGPRAQAVRSWSTAAVIDQLDSIGYFKPGQKDALLAAGTDFAPMMRLLDEEVGELRSGSNGKPIKAIGGGLDPSKPIAPPLEGFVAQSQRIATFVERQRVKNLLGDYAEAHPDLLAKEVRKVPVASDSRTAPGAFTVYRDGQRVQYTATPEILAALDRATPKQANLFLQAGIFAARTLRAGATLTPDFAIRNFLRDQVSAGVYGAESTKLFYRPFADFAVGLWAQTPMGGKLHDFATRWEASGGAMSDYINIERPNIQRTVADVRNNTFAQRTWADWRAEKNLFAKIFYPVLRPLEAVSSTVEQATRIGAFRRAQLSGANDLDAGWYSRNITLDFGRSGSLAQRWNSVEAFANASLQDVARFSRAMRERPVATTISALTTVTVPALAAWAMNKDDPDYQSLPEWERAAFLHVKKLDDGRWIRLPRPVGALNLIYGYGVQKMLEAASDEGLAEPVNELLATLFQETPLRFSPVHPDPGPTGDFTGSLEMVPSAMQPAVEAGAGEGGWSSFRRGPIVPQGLQEGLLPQDRASDQTTALARAAGAKLGVAPLKIDYLIRGYGAGLTMTGLQAAEKLTGAPGAGPAAPPALPTTAKDIPGVGGLISSPSWGFNSQPVTDLYAMQKAAADAAGSLTLAGEQGRVFEYQRILRDHPEALVAESLTDARRQLKDLRDARRAIRTAPGMTPEARLDALLQIDQAVTQISAGTMHWVSDFLRGYRSRDDKKP